MNYKDVKCTNKSNNNDKIIEFCQQHIDIDKVILFDGCKLQSTKRFEKAGVSKENIYVPERDLCTRDKHKEYGVHSFLGSFTKFTNYVGCPFENVNCLFYDSMGFITGNRTNRSRLSYPMSEIMYVLKKTKHKKFVLAITFTLSRNQNNFRYTGDEHLPMDIAHEKNFMLPVIKNTQFKIIKRYSNNYVKQNGKNKMMFRVYYLEKDLTIIPNERFIYHADQNYMPSHWSLAPDEQITDVKTIYATNKFLNDSGEINYDIDDETDDETDDEIDDETYDMDDNMDDDMDDVDDMDYIDDMDDMGNEMNDMDIMDCKSYGQIFNELDHIICIRNKLKKYGMINN